MAEKVANTNKAVRREGWLLLTGAAIVLLILFYQLYQALLPQLDRTDKLLKEGAAVKLERVISKDRLRKVIADGSYFTDPRDISLLVDSLAARLLTTGEPDNLGALNKSGFAITAPLDWQPTIGGPDFAGRLLASRQRLGFDSALYVQELTGPVSRELLSGASSSGTGRVTIANGDQEMTGQVLYKGQPMPGVLVQLREHIPSLDEDSLTGIIGYARTDAKGAFTFAGLHRDSGYSVLPLKPGFEFGSRKGIASLNGKAYYTFTAKPHKVRLIGSIIYGQLKEDGVLIVRTPEEFKMLYQLIAGGLLLAFFLVQLILSVRKRQPDAFLLPILLLLCGISLLTLFSIQNPLTDSLHAFQTLQGIAAGLTAYTVLATVNIGKWYTRWWFDGLFNFRQKNIYQQKGWTWLALAILLALLTVFIGTGPEGSGVKVNLQLGGFTFQPSEITKYLLLFFLAAFFAANEEHIRNFSDIRWRLYINWSVFAGIATILMLYLLMGDMGPALVVCFTFLFFYSIARGNLLLTVSAGAGYAILLALLPGWIATAAALVLVLIASLIKGHLRSTKWFGAFAAIADAPVIIIMVIAAFAFGDRVPGIGQRLADRKSMWLSQWNNDVFGGDHLAHSYWTLSSGGFTGQGIGKGFPNTMPASHTDMILPSIGEELGWLGLVAVLLLFGILIHRTFLIARRSGQPFTFYLSAGIAITIGIQLLIIAGGSIGLLPLTGVAVPFLSYGKISLIINLAALGIVAGISAREGQEVQRERIQKSYDPVLATGIIFFLLGIGILAAKLLMVQVVDRDKYIVKQARVVMRNGIPVYSYNPRIDKLMKLLAAGNVYDRNGLVLATSEAGAIQHNIDSLQKAGIPKEKLTELMQKRVRRFYPFGEHLYFWTGDYNTRLFWGQANGYFAEARHLTALRGFGINREIQDSVYTLYQPDRFTRPFHKTVPMVRYDYTALVEGLKSGVDSNQAPIKKIRDKDRSLYLSVDAALQVEIQDSLRNSLFNHKRISVVVLNATTGDVLASALNPLPNLQSPELMELPDRDRIRLETPVTERDLGMTYATAPGSTAKILTAMAGLNKMGIPATEVKYNDIFRQEIFRDNKKEQEPFIPKVPFVDMREAIINSSNIFFIRLANEQYLEEEMAALYEATGMNIEQRGGYNYSLPNDQLKLSGDLAAWRKEVLNGNHKQYNNPNYKGTTKRYRSVFSGLAWGQSVLTATPASMARMAGGIANGGVLQPSRYVTQQEGKQLPLQEPVKLAKDTAYAGVLRRFMIDQSSTTGRYKIKEMKVAGKTGTPERIIKGEKESDGWYVFFAPTPDQTSYTVTCIRIEEGQSSANAVLLGNTVAKILAKRAYISSF